MSISARDGRKALRLVLCALFCLLLAACGGKEPVDDVVASGTVILEPPSADGGSDDGLRERSLGPSPAAPAVETHPTAPAAAEGFRPDWQAFCDFCARRLENGEAAPQLHLLRQLRASWEPDCLRLTPRAETLLHQTEKQRPQLEQALAAWGAGHLRLEFVAPRQARTEAELIEEFRNRPEMQACLRLLNANIEHCTESNQGDTHA